MTAEKRDRSLHQLRRRQTGLPLWLAKNDFVSNVTALAIDGDVHSRCNLQLFRYTFYFPSECQNQSKTIKLPVLHNFRAFVIWHSLVGVSPFWSRTQWGTGIAPNFKGSLKESHRPTPLSRKYKPLGAQELSFGGS